MYLALCKRDYSKNSDLGLDEQYYLKIASEKKLQSELKNAKIFVNKIIDKEIEKYRNKISKLLKENNED